MRTERLKRIKDERAAREQFNMRVVNNAKAEPVTNKPDLDAINYLLKQDGAMPSGKYEVSYTYL